MRLPLQVLQFVFWQEKEIDKERKLFFLNEKHLEIFHKNMYNKVRIYYEL